LTKNNPYKWAGFGLLIAGGLISLPAYFLFQLTWLTAPGIYILILSFIPIALGKDIPELPPGVCSLMLETGTDNISTLIEEPGIKSKAIYLPSSLTSKYPRTFIPLHSNGSHPEITKTLPLTYCQIWVQSISDDAYIYSDMPNQGCI
jgi:hypothetical protein